MARSFSGTSGSFINMGAASIVNFADNSPMALACWVNFAVLTGTQSFVARGYDGRTGYSFQDDGTNLSFGSFDGSVTHGASWARTYATGAWHHIYGDYSGTPGTGVWRLFVDGSQVNTVTDTTGPLLVTARDFTAGGVNTSGVGAISQSFAGNMCDVAVWNGPLTGTEISNLGGGTVRPSLTMSKTLLGYWPFNGGSPEPDLSGNGNVGVLTGTGFVADPPFVSNVFTNRMMVGFGPALTGAASLDTTPPSIPTGVTLVET